jgi:hypothetical protein
VGGVTEEVFLDEDGELCRADAGPWTLELAGYRLASDAAPDAAVAIASEVMAGGLVSAVVPLRGLRAAEPHRRDGVNPMGNRSACPLAVSTGPVHVGEVYAAAVVLSADRTQVDRARAITVDFATSDVDVIRVVWPDGQVDEVPVRAS